ALRTVARVTRAQSKSPQTVVSLVLDQALRTVARLTRAPPSRSPPEQAIDRAQRAHRAPTLDRLDVRLQGIGSRRLRAKLLKQVLDVALLCDDVVAHGLV